MPTFKRLSAYLLTFLVLLGVLAFTDLWRPLDYFIYRTFYLDPSRNIDLADDIVLIDIPYRTRDGTAFDLPHYRKRLTDLLTVIAAHGEAGERPAAVILDMYISNDDRELSALRAAIEELAGKRVKVYAVFNAKDAGQKTFEKIESEHALQIYELLEGGYLHTIIEHRMGVLSYPSELEIPTEDGHIRFIEALPIRVARDLSKSENPDPPLEYVLPLGNEAEIDSQTYAFRHDGQATSGGQFFKSKGADGTGAPDFDMDDRLLLVGSLEEDRVTFVQQAGPQLVAWALDDQRNANRNARRPLNHPALVIGQILFFALLTVIVFALLFKYVKRLQTKPLLIACFSFGAGVGVLATFAAALLALGYVTPSGLTLLAMILAAILAWRFALKFLVTGVAEGSGKYDVFISYSRQHSDWVVKNVYEPLKAMRNADGNPLSIFFDRAEIGVGEAFTAKYMWAIVDSRFFVPVFSEGYYGKNHCRNEMDVAYKRSVEKKIMILPIAHSDEAVPKIYSHMNYVDANANPNFMEDIRKAVLGSPEPARTEQ